MKLKMIATTALAASLTLSPVSPLVRPVHADAGDAIAGALIGGIIGNAIARDQQRQRQKTYSKRSTKSSKPSGISSAQREANREVQTALNMFGYPVGTPDGSIGPKTRGAISGYQAFMGYPATGQLTDYERTVLVTAYQRGQAGGPLIAQTVATSPYGMKGLLLAQRDEMAGVVPGVMAQAPLAVPAAPVVAAAALPLLLPEVAEPAAEPAPSTAALPSFMGAGGAQGSLASNCNKVSLLTNTNGGYTTAATMSDANFALSEQFCLARTYAMASGEELAAKVAGFTPAQISEQCAGFGPVLQEHVAALSLKPAAEVLAGVEGFVLQSGMAPAQLSGTAKVCLGVGYTTDDMDVAIGSALLLAGLGEGAYAELLGHHLSQGYGANIRPDLAMEWYDLSLASGGQVFAPGLQGRGDLIRKAAYTLNGRAADLAPQPVVQEAALPAFSVAPEPAVPDAAPVEQAAVPALPEVTAEVDQPTDTPPSAAMATGAEVAMMAARLPFLIFSGN
ncbi:MAG: peptidoglycan-binding domain-containing protein [Pseudomonadota bacterium]